MHPSELEPWAKGTGLLVALLDFDGHGGCLRGSCPDVVVVEVCSGQELLLELLEDDVRGLSFCAYRFEILLELAACRVRVLRALLHECGNFAVGLVPSRVSLPDALYGHFHLRVDTWGPPGFDAAEDAAEDACEDAAEDAIESSR